MLITLSLYLVKIFIFDEMIKQLKTVIALYLYVFLIYLLAYDRSGLAVIKCLMDPIRVLSLNNEFKSVTACGHSSHY